MAGMRSRLSSDDDEQIFAAPPPVRPRVKLRFRGGGFVQDEVPNFVPGYASDTASAKRELLAKMSAQGHSRAFIRCDLLCVMVVHP
jgi:hypothetical protein